MKITHLSPYHFPHVGGVEKHLTLLNQQLQLLTVSTTVITQKHAAQLQEREKIAGTLVIRFPVPSQQSSIWGKLRYKFAVWKAMYTQFPILQSSDIIHIHDVFWWLIPFLLFLKRKKIFITFHGYEGSSAPGKIQVFWHRVAAWYCAGNICVGDFHSKWYGIHPTQITYGAVTPNIVSKKLVQIPAKPKVIYIGRLSEDSGIQVYLDALVLLKKQKIYPKLDVYGAGDDQTILENFCRKNGITVSFLGAVENAEAKIKDYDIAFVSRYLAILEVLQVGLPIIAQYNNAIKYDYLALAPFSKWITIHQTAPQIAASIEALMAATTYTQPVAARQWIAQQTWRHIALLYLSLWQTGHLQTK